jgi:hypothetical protein
VADATVSHYNAILQPFTGVMHRETHYFTTTSVEPADLSAVNERAAGKPAG